MADPQPTERLQECREKVYVRDALIAEQTAELVRLRAVVDEARIVSEWCDSIGSGPIEVLNEELRLLGLHARATLATPATCPGCGLADDHQQTCIRGGGIP